MREVAQFFKVLADEARLKILWLLFNNKELCVCDIMAALNTTQSKASRHLATLRHAGLVTDRKEGLWSYYSLSPLVDEFKCAQLEMLRDLLIKREDAASALKDLHQWLTRKKKNSSCVESCGIRNQKINSSTRKSKPRRNIFSRQSASLRG